MKKKIFFIFIVLFIILFVGATIFSISHFKVFNPVSSCFGMLQILFTEKEYIQVQKYPYKVVFSKPQAFENYMVEQGFNELKEEQLGSIRVFSNGDKKEIVSTRTNAYYTIGISNNENIE